MDLVVDTIKKKEDILVAVFLKLKSGNLEEKDVPMAMDEELTKMYDGIWMETGIEEEEIVSDFRYHKLPFNARYADIRDLSWRRLSNKFVM